MTVLIDTNVLLASWFARDVNHLRSKHLLKSLRNEQNIVPSPVLNELFYLASVRIGYSRAVVSFSGVQRIYQIEPLTSNDMRRMGQIMLQYASAKFDFVDTAIMAQAERLNITRVATFDRRDFSFFRPAHCEYLELLP